VTTTERELESFTVYVMQHLEREDSLLSIDELFDQWRAENPSDALYAENVAAINASIQDFNHGERGTVAGEHSHQLRREFGIGEE